MILGMREWLKFMTLFLTAFGGDGAFCFFPCWIRDLSANVWLSLAGVRTIVPRTSASGLVTITDNPPPSP